MHARRARIHRAQHLQERRHIEDIAHALAIRLQQHRKCRIASRHTQQVIRALALRPQRSTPRRASSRQQQRPCRRLTKLRGKQRRRAKLPQHQLRRLRRIEQDQLRIGRRIRLRKAQHESVIGPHHLHIAAPCRAQPAADGHGPRRMHAAAKRRQHAHAPVAQLIAHALDHNRAVIRHRRRRQLLVGKVAQQILRRLRIQVVLTRQPRHRRVARHLAQLAHQRADAPAELQRPPRCVAMPEGHLARLARRRRNQHAIMRDLIDAPRRRAQNECLAGAALEDHLLVQLAHAHRPPFGARKKDAIQPAVRNRPAIQDRQHLRALARCQQVADAVPRHARTQLGKFI